MVEQFVLWLMFDMYQTSRRISFLIGLLESKGFKIFMENGTLKILNSALVVMMAKCYRYLYFLKGSTVVGGTVIVFYIIEKVVSDTTRPLGHAVDNVFQGLVKQDLLKGVKACKLEFCELCISWRSKLESSLTHQFIILVLRLTMYTQICGGLLRLLFLEVDITLLVLLMTNFAEFG